MCDGGDSCCTPGNKCAEDDGDCDNDSDCKVGLKCGNQNCSRKKGLHWEATDDCCYAPSSGKIDPYLLKSLDLT